MRESKKIVCNKCGKDFRVENDIIKEGILSVEINWGYFSDKDGEVHSFELCEECYNQTIETFKLPVTIKKLKEYV